MYYVLLRRPLFYSTRFLSLWSACPEEDNPNNSKDDDDNNNIQDAYENKETNEMHWGSVGRDEYYVLVRSPMFYSTRCLPLWSAYPEEDNHNNNKDNDVNSNSQSVYENKTTTNEKNKNKKKTKSIED